MYVAMVTCAALDKLPLRDEGPQDRSFVSFRRSLTGALDKGNREWVVARIDPAVRFSFGGDNGKAALLASWGREPALKDRFFKELRVVVGLGGGFRDGSFWAPYTYAFWPDDLDAFEDAVAVRPLVRVKKESRDDSETVTTLNYDVVKLVVEEGLAPAHWRKIEFNGKVGWARTSDVRSGVDARACFTKVKGSWRLTAFVEGD